MGEVINLRKWLQAREKAAKAARAAANRKAFGRTRAEKKRDAADAAQRDALLDGNRLEKPDPAAG